MEDQYTDELYHHGVKGMKWGVRKQRQSKGGSLIKRWKRHKAKIEQKKKAKEQAEKDKLENEARESLTKLKSRVERMRLEREALQLEKDIATLSPQKKSLGKKFLEDSIIPGAKDAAKSLTADYLKKVGKQYLGLDEKQSKSIIDLAKESSARKTYEQNQDWFKEREAAKKAAKEATKSNGDKGKDAVDDYIRKYRELSPYREID